MIGVLVRKGNWDIDSEGDDTEKRVSPTEERVLRRNRPLSPPCHQLSGCQDYRKIQIDAVIFVTQSVMGPGAPARVSRFLFQGKELDQRHMIRNELETVP